MTEDKRFIPGSEIVYNHAKEREKAVHVFANNFGQFLEEKANRVNLLDLSFVSGIEKLVVMNFIGDTPAPYTYDKMNEQLLAIFDRYRKADSQAITLNESFILEIFDDMPERLKGFVGQSVSAVSEIYELVSMPGEKASVSRVRYFTADGNGNPVYEYWIAERTQQEESEPDGTTKKGTALRIPILT